MTARDLLRQLNKARKLIATFPMGTEILNFSIDGQGREGGTYIHISSCGNGYFDRLIECGAVKAEFVKSRPFPGGEYIERSVMASNFQVFTLEDKEKAAPGDSSTEDGKAES